MTTETDKPRLAPLSSLPEGTLPVALGLVISGICSYAFIAVASRALDDANQRALQQLWFGTFALAPGLFLPLEQEVGRALSHRRVHGLGGLPVIRRAAMLGLSMSGILLLAMLVFRRVLVERFFRDNELLLGGLALGVLGFGATHLCRGVLSGNNRFRSYGLVLGVDGLVRLVAALGFAVIGVTSSAAFGLLIGTPAFIALVLVIRPRPFLVDGPPALLSELTANLGWLLAGSFWSALLINAGPLSADLLADQGQDNLVTAFSYGVLVSRVPLFMFQAVQAALLPKLARLAAGHMFAEFKAGFRQLMMVVSGVALVGSVGAFLVGPLAVRLAFGVTLGRQDMTLLALASGVYMMAMALSQAVIALEGHAWVGIGWTISVVAFGLTLVAPLDLFLRVESALIVSAASALVVFAIALSYRLRRQPTEV